MSAIGLINAVVIGFINLPPQGHIANSLEEIPKFVFSVTLGSSGLWASVCPSRKWGWGWVDLGLLQFSLARQACFPEPIVMVVLSCLGDCAGPGGGRRSPGGEALFRGVWTGVAQGPLCRASHLFSSLPEVGLQLSSQVHLFPSAPSS